MMEAVQLPLRFDPGRLNRDLGGIRPEDWVPHFNRAYYEGDWSAIPLRSIGGAARRISPDPTRLDDFADTPLLERCPYFREVLRSFETPLRAVRLLRLGAGAKIREHTDYNLGYEDGEIRIHIPVATNPEVEFVLNNRRIVMQEGESWYLNFNLPHRLFNGGHTDRIHLVVDCQLNEWARGVLERAADGALAGCGKSPPG